LSIRNRIAKRIILKIFGSGGGEVDLVKKEVKNLMSLFFSKIHFPFQHLTERLFWPTARCVDSCRQLSVGLTITRLFYFYQQRSCSFVLDLTLTAAVLILPTAVLLICSRPDYHRSCSDFTNSGPAHLF
jgi:hypothetical protein